MSDVKAHQVDILARDSESQQDAPLPEVKGSTAEDQRDMARMGKSQELRRNFGFFSIFGYSIILMSSWECSLTTLIIPLTNGGTGGAIVMFLVTFIGMTFVVLSMAEMASMAPTSGGQYHWVSEFAPKKHQKFLSYIVGWLSCLGYQTGIVSIAFMVGGQIQGLMVLNNESYAPERWHGTMIVIAVTTFAVIFNTLLARKLPLVEGIVLVVHLFGFFATLITMWVLGPRSSASEVFNGFQDNAGWGNIGLAVILGQLSSILSLSGADAATHMSEELRDASRILPQAMLWTILSNGVLGFIMLVTFCFMIGDVESVIMSPTGQPHIQIMYNATQSKAGTSALAAITIAITLFGTVNMVTSCSRQTFAFARDNGLPFASFFSRVQPGWDIPLNSVIFGFIISILLSLINIGSTVAFNSIASLGTGALMASYIISIGCIFLKRWRNEVLLPCKFSLGKAGIWVNAISVGYLSFAFFWGFWPTFPSPTPDLMNWNVLIFGVVVIYSVIYYFIKGKKVYVGPVEYINKNV